ncbi:hypothetical protein [uncultured Chryseobacterium sp.]|uniref:hypothetical protein n=1 Tax=uncultured Chryseobacterium sp. TaxID=259322 RepID=UPI0025DD642C|nr:hypothetical protein [uncultured Chryseobacterium sp.]
MMEKSSLVYNLIFCIIISIIIYWKLPFEITRKSDIEFENKIIQNIEGYQKKYGRLPERSDYKTLEKLGLSFKDPRIYLDYATDHKSNFELAYLEGFDGPYLLWKSTNRQLKMDFPEIYK